MASGVEFDEDNMNFARPGVRPGMSGRGNAPGQREEHGIPGWLIRHGLAKSYGSAQVVMLGIVLVNAIIIFMLLKFFL